MFVDTESNRAFMKLLQQKNKVVSSWELIPIEDGYRTCGKTLFMSKYGEMQFFRESLLRGGEPNLSSAVDLVHSMSVYLKYHHPNISSEGVITNKPIRLKDKITLSTKYGNVSFTDWHCLLRVSTVLTLSAAEDKTSFWVNRAKDLRKGSEDIDYSKVIVTNVKTHPIFRCKIHNYEYTQRTTHHMRGVNGCVFCAESTIKYTFENIKKHIDIFKGKTLTLYILELYNEDERFYKVGVTSRKIAYRLSQLSSKYSIKILYRDYGTFLEMYTSEQTILKEMSSFSYTPKVKFGGYTECLSENPLNFYYYYYEQNVEEPQY